MKKARRESFLSGAARQSGFTLIELMIIIAILGTLSAIAVPNILSYRTNSRLRAGANEMLATFRKAQVAAVKRNYNSVIDFNTAGKAIVYLDNGAGGGTANDAIQNGSEPILDELSIPVGCSWPAAKITFAGQKTGFSPRGLPLNIGAVEIHSTSASAKAQYKASLSLAGHTKLEVSTDGGSTWK
jgi:prepilin-type N-terminal cleavage/methylation domain-containing protein